MVSDLEVDTVEENGSLWEIKYPIVGGGGEIIVATTRPETMLGDTARRGARQGRALHAPASARMVELPLTGRQIPIVADRHRARRQAVARSGVRLGRREGHARARSERLRGQPDREACRSSRSSIAHGKMCAPAPAKYVGMTVEEARKAVVADLEAGGAPRRGEAVQGAARPQPALGRGDRADADGAVVGEGRAARREGGRRRRAGQDEVRARARTPRRSCTG